MVNFNRIASIYDFLKKLIFKDQLDKAATYFINQIPEEAQILIIGGGSGQLLPYFHSTQRITYVEASEKMSLLAKKRAFSAEIEFKTTDILNFSPGHRFDVVITPFFLDCFDDQYIARIFSHINHMLKNGGLWLHSDFYPQNKQQQYLVRFMYFCFRISTGLKVSKVPNFDKLFSTEKFNQEKKVAFKDSMIHSYIYKKIALE